MRTLGDHISGRDNNFNLIRFIAALLVIFSHAYPLGCGEENAADPLARAVGFSLGSVAVWSFFVTSGFLITASWTRSRSLWRYLLSRVARIYPGLVVAVGFCVVVVGGAFTTFDLSDYYDEWLTWHFFKSNATLRDIVYSLPGVFEENTYPGAVNGSLWTLPYEVVLYVIVAVLGLIGLFRSKVVSAGVLALVAIGLLCTPTDWKMPTEWLKGTPFLWIQVRNLFALFLLGGAAWMARDRIPLNRGTLLAAVGVVCVLAAFGLYSVLFPLVFAYMVLGIAYVPGGFIRRFNRFGDYSYGLYIYAFPVQQMVEAIIPAGGAFANFALSCPVTLALAFVSWHVVEKPSLNLARRITSRRSARENGDKS